MWPVLRLLWQLVRVLIRPKMARGRIERMMSKEARGRDGIVLCIMLGEESRMIRRVCEVGMRLRRYKLKLVSMDSYSSECYRPSPRECQEEVGKGHTFV